jgi:adenine deaminase
MLYHVTGIEAGQEAADLLQTVHLSSLSLAMLKFPARSRNVRAIGVIPGQLLTRQDVLEATMRERSVVVERRRDLVKLAVVERHRGTGNIGLVTGFGLRAGALASSVGRLTHNLIAVGADNRDLLCALHEISRLGGGLAVCRGGRVLSSLAPPYRGTHDARTVGAGDRNLRSLAPESEDTGVLAHTPVHGAVVPGTPRHPGTAAYGSRIGGH